MFLYYKNTCLGLRHLTNSCYRTIKQDSNGTSQESLKERRSKHFFPVRLTADELIYVHEQSEMASNKCSPNQYKTCCGFGEQVSG